MEPQVDEPVLPDLTDGGPGDLGPRVSLLERRFADLDLVDTDLTRASFEACELNDLRLDGADLTGVHVIESRLAGWDAPALKAPRSSWRDVTLQRSRLGAVELYDAALRSVAISSCKLGFLNLRSADLQDVIISGCQVEELDLTGAKVRRLAVVDSKIATLTTTAAELVDVDLRAAELEMITEVGSLKGAWIDLHQLSLLAPLLAAHVGLEVG